MGCSSLYSRSLDRGDQMAALGRWDEAALLYERAVRVEPEEAEARAKLHAAHQHQAHDRVVQGRALLTAGRPREALKPLVTAARIDPESTEAKTALEEARAAIVGQARKELDAGNTRQALLVAREVLALLPGDPDARAIEETARTRIADQAAALGQAFEKDGKLVPALVEYAEALVFRPENETANARFPELRIGLRAQVTFHVVLGSFDGDPKADDLGGNVGATDLARGLDPAYLIRFASSAPTPEGFTLNGMRLGGAFHDYGFAKQSSRTNRSCDYICGTDLVPNPEYGQAQADLNAREIDRSNAVAAALATGTFIPRLERSLDAARRDSVRAQRDVERARQTLGVCETSSKNPATECAALRVERDQAQTRLVGAQDREQRLGSDLATAESERSRADENQAAAESASLTARARFNATPMQMTIDRHCNYNYGVDLFSEQGRLDLSLKGESLYERVSVLNESVTGRFVAEDETFPAEHGKCGILESGDPLDLAPESVVRRQTLDSAVLLAQGRIVTAFEKYRSDYLTRARAFEVDPKRDDAIDAYMRYLTTQIRVNDDGARAEASVSGLLGVTPDAVRRASGP